MNILLKKLIGALMWILIHQAYPDCIDRQHFEPAEEKGIDLLKSGWSCSIKLNICTRNGSLIWAGAQLQVASKCTSSKKSLYKYSPARVVYFCLCLCLAVQNVLG